MSVKTDERQGQQAQETKKGLKFFKKIEVNLKLIKERVGASVSYDMEFREMKFGLKDVAFCYTNGLVDEKIMTLTMSALTNLKREQLAPDALKRFLETYLIHLSVVKVDTFDEAIDSMLSGLVLVLIDDEEAGLLIDARSYAGRSPEEPDTERVVRGARDGFVENIIVNTSLLRRRIRDERLRMEMIKVGSRSKTDVCIAYLKDVADPGMVEMLKKKIREIKIDGIPMGEKTVEEFIVERYWHPYPLVRFTERADVAASHILEGHALVFVDTSPGVMISPTTFFHHVQHAEEYRQIPVVGAYIRWVRFIGIFFSLFALPIWMFYALNPGYLPPSLAFIGPEETGQIPIFWQFLLAELGIDLMRLAAVHTPSPLATAMGLVAAVLIGEVAIEVGLFMPETILYLAVAAIGMFATPSYELGLANRLTRLVLLFATFFFGIPGFMVGLTAFIIFLASTTSLNTPYFWPFIPFNWAAMRQVLIRSAVPALQKRPSIAHPVDDERM